MKKLGIHFDLRDDGTADIQLNFNNLGQCLWVFIRLLGEVENRHGSDCAQQLVINLPHLGQGYAKKKQNEDLLHDLLESGIPCGRTGRGELGVCASCEGKRKTSKRRQASRGEPGRLRDGCRGGEA
jgi:hypothetical protein